MHLFEGLFFHSLFVADMLLFSFFVPAAFVSPTSTLIAWDALAWIYTDEQSHSQFVRTPLPLTTSSRVVDTISMQGDILIRRVNISVFTNNEPSAILARFYSPGSANRLISSRDCSPTGIHPTNLGNQIQTFAATIF